jgi:endonuclease YncB( thermonuclease family)
MLDPTNTAPLQQETTESERENKRTRVLLNGIHAVEQFARKEWEGSEKARAAVTKLANADVPQKVRLRAKEVAIQLAK